MKTIWGATEPYVLKPNSTVLNGGSVYHQEITSLDVYRLRSAKDKRSVRIDMYSSDNRLWAGVHEVVEIQRSQPSRRARISKPMQRERTAEAYVYSLNACGWDGFVDMVRKLAAKLREDYWERYKSPLNAPLEAIMISDCKAPINEQ